MWSKLSASINREKNISLILPVLFWSITVMVYFNRITKKAPTTVKCSKIRTDLLDAVLLYYDLFVKKIETKLSTSWTLFWNKYDLLMPVLITFQLQPLDNSVAFFFCFSMWAKAAPGNLHVVPSGADGTCKNCLQAIPTEFSGVPLGLQQLQKHTQWKIQGESIGFNGAKRGDLSSSRIPPNP